MMATSIDEIADINGRGRLLSLNARIEASRAGDKLGAAFGVVAQEMQDLSNTTARVTHALSNGANQAITELERMSDAPATNVRGLRLSEYAGVNIDLIDRCLYERSCDVRWWATDASLVDALTDRTAAAYEYASRRLGVILDAYTVYFDLALCDTQGNVIANGRPKQFASQGLNVESSAVLVGRRIRPAAVSLAFNRPTNRLWSTTNGHWSIRAPFAKTEMPKEDIGVLGIVFNWDAPAQAIVHNTPLSSDEKGSTR